MSDGHEKFHSLWANIESEETAIFAMVVDIISALSDYRIFHYGDYEKLALIKMKLRLPESFHQRIDEMLDHSVNVLSLVHSHFYFPTYSNGLKDIGGFLGYKWFDPGVVGLNTIIWRTNWNLSNDEEAKTKLTVYNKDDCNALKLLCNFILCSEDRDKLADDGLPKTILTQQMLKTRPHWQLFAPKSYALEDLKHVSKRAYFDYQREKVFVRTNSHIKALKKRVQYNQKRSTRPNRVVNIELAKFPRCRSPKIQKIKKMTHDVVDLKFSRGGIRKCITRFVSWRYMCNKCLKQFTSQEKRSRPPKYGHSLESWCIYLNNVHGVNMSQVRKNLGNAFDLFLPEEGPWSRAKRHMMDFYRPLYDEILQNILLENVIHIDETTVKLRLQQHGYVWVLTSVDKVYYFYRQTRETAFLKDMLAPFSGTLVSDFYTGYDSLPCGQQKCLVHLVRDIDDDLLRNPFDNELKSMAQEFGIVLRSIVDTIDKYGLRRRHLQKHKKEAHRFLTQLSKKDYSSETAVKYMKRFVKSGTKMFTFLDHDGVPWNNNNAEHAIKRFAKHRRDTEGRYSERTLEEYLVMATVFETCEYNNINVLQFLLSKVNTLGRLLQMARRKVRSRQSVPILAETQSAFANTDI